MPIPDRENRAECLYRVASSAGASRRQEEPYGFAIKLRESLQIDGVDATLAEFALRHEGLRSPEGLRHLDLRQARLPSRVTEALQEILILGAVNRAPALLGVP